MRCLKCFKNYSDCENYDGGYCQAPLKNFKEKDYERNNDNQIKKNQAK